MHWLKISIIRPTQLFERAASESFSSVFSFSSFSVRVLSLIIFVRVPEGRRNVARVVELDRINARLGRREGFAGHGKLGFAPSCKGWDSSMPVWVADRSGP